MYYTLYWQPELNDAENSQLLKREFLKVHNTKYLSVKCAVLMHLSFTCVTRMTDFGVVFVYMLPTLNVMGHGSYLMGHGSRVTYQMVNGSLVNSSDPLPALGWRRHGMRVYIRLAILAETRQIADG